MPKERTLRLIEEAAAIGVVGINPSGGDIMVYPHLEEILEALKKYNFVPVMLCTKSFVSSDKAKALADIGIVLDMQFSVDSTVDDIADYMVQSKGFCDRILRTIDNCLEAGIKVNVKSVITPYNILTIPKLYRDLKKRGVSSIRFAAYRRSGFHHSDDLFNHMESYRWLEEQVRKLQQEFPNEMINIQNGAPDLEPRTLDRKKAAWPAHNNCTAGREGMMICADGKVIPCEQMPETEEYFCGDVSHQSIQEVWDGDRLREMTYGVPQAKFKGQSCYDCEEREECVNEIGLCIRDLSTIYQGGIYQPPEGCPKYKGEHIRIM